MRHETINTVMLTLGQLLGAALAMFGLYLLLGTAWTVTVGGVALLVVCIWAEAVTRPSLPQRRVERTLRAVRRQTQREQRKAG
jgi:hypothetical protein